MEDQRDNPNIIGSEIIIYQTEDGYTKIDVKFEDETVWLTQAQLCELYQTSKSNISEHIKHIFEEEELDEESVVRKFRITESATSSPSEKMFFKCSLMVDLAFPNSAAIWSWVSQTVSSPMRTSILMLPSAERYINISFSIA